MVSYGTIMAEVDLDQRFVPPSLITMSMVSYLADVDYAPLDQLPCQISIPAPHRWAPFWSHFLQKIHHLLLLLLHNTRLTYYTEVGVPCATSCQPATNLCPTMDDNNDSSQSDESILAKELYELCSSDSLSEDGLREIIERYGLNDNRHVSDYSFFIAACCNEKFNEGIIRFLLEYFPAAAMATDETGWSPLHYTCG